MNLSTPMPADAPRVTVTPSPLPGILPNPFKGFAAQNWDKETSGYKVPQSLFYSDVSWKQLQPQENKIEWEVLERTWADHFKSGRRVGFRFKMSEPIQDQSAITPDMDIPQWLIDKCKMTMRKYQLNDGGAMKYGYMPDWNNSRLLEQHDALIKEFGARYAKNPNVAWVDVGSYGFWGEWHLYQNEGDPASSETQRRILETYLKYLGEKKLIIAFDSSFASEFIVRSGHGLRHDCVGTQNDSFNKAIENLRLKGVDVDRMYVTGIFSGELCSEGVIKWLKDDKKKFREQVLDFVKAHHFSWLGPSGASEILKTKQKSKEWPIVEELYRTLGYHFWIHDLSHEQSIAAGASIRVDATIINEGVAPFYYPWPVEFALLDKSKTVVSSQELTSWDVRRWLPGKHSLTATIAIPSTLAGGIYTVSLAILDAYTRKPGVRFANTGLNQETLRSELSTIVVTKN